MNLNIFSLSYKKLSIIIFIFLGVFISLKANTVLAIDVWQNVGSAGFSSGTAYYTSLAFSGSTPYIAYTSGFQGPVVVKKLVGTNWVNVGNPSLLAESAYYTYIAFDGSTPYVAYRDINNSNGISVMKFDGTNWVYVGIPGFSLSTTEYISLFVNGSTPYVVFSDTGSGSSLSVMKFDGTNWVYVGNPGFTSSTIFSPSIAFDGPTPYVAYEDCGGNACKASVMKFDGTNWEYVGAPGFSAGEAASISISFNASTPYVAYTDTVNGYRATVAKFDGTNWINVGTPGFSEGQALYISLFFSGDTQYISYQDGGNNNKVTVMRLDGTNWVYVGNPGFSVGPASYTSLAFYLDTPYVAFQDGGNGNKATVMSFETLILPALTTSSASLVTEESATLNGSLISAGGNPTIRGFEYGLTTDYGTTTTENGSFSTGSYIKNITGLDCNTTYHFRSYATKYGYKAYGDDMTFTTSQCPRRSSGGTGFNTAVMGCLNGNFFNIITGASCAVDPSLIFSRTLKIIAPRMTGVDIQYLQTYLNNHGYNCGVADGVFGTQTTLAVAQFQIANGLKADGAFGPKTREFVK